MAATKQDLEIGWVKPATAITGLDHLGSAAPCIAIYATLLPGINNVTDRARYYSFYPWLLWKFSQSGGTLDAAQFHELYRRADCLFTLIAEAHSRAVGGDADRHGSRMVGRDTLVPALRDLEAGKQLRLSAFATQEDSDRRYFKNRLGGLGQYYLGTLEELGILAGRKGQFILYDKVMGGEIAARFDAGVPGTKFWDALSRDVVTPTLLNELVAFCPCQLSANHAEFSWLADLFFERAVSKEGGSGRRRNAFALLLHLTRALETDPDAAIDPRTFRESCYAGSLPDGSLWAIPETLIQTRDEWRLYQRNELLSVSSQALLTMLVRALELCEGIPSTARDVAEQLCSTPGVRRIAGKKWIDYVRECRAELPPLERHGDENHELATVRRLFALDTMGGPLPELGKGTECVLRVLATMVVRAESGDTSPYGKLPMTDAVLADYPINLASFQTVELAWRALTVGEVVKWLICEWACETHLRIALRKLRFEQKDTFRFYPTDRGLTPRKVPPFDYSNPRLRQAIQMLRDLYALEADADGRMQITPAGREWLESVCQK